MRIVSYPRPLAALAVLVSALGAPTLALAAEAPFGGDYTWMNGQSRQKDFPLQAFDKAVTLSLYLDTYFAFSGNHPKDDTLTGSATVARHNELQINLASIGVEWNYRNVIGRLSLQYGSLINIVQDLDGTAARGRSLTTQNMRYIREGTLGYHFDVSHGLNVEAGIFMSYMGLESYLTAENWNYVRSVACDHTPFYFQGIRIQYFPSTTVKIEPWIMNGWQSYGKWNNAPSGGVALRWSPRESLSFLANFYVGTDTKGVPDRVRFHHDDSLLFRYFRASGSRGLSTLAFSLNNHVGFEGGGAGLPGADQAYLVGTSLVHRSSFYRDKLSLSLRGELFSNPTRYLAQYPPPGFATGAGTTLKVWGLTATAEVMPTDFLTVRTEVVYRRSDTPFFAGPNGTTSSDGFQGTPDPTGAPFVVDGATEQALYVVSANFRL